MEPLTGLLLAGLAAAATAFLYRLFSLVRAANLTDWGSGWLNLLDGVNRLFCRYYHRMNDVVLPLPAEGPAIVVANHVSGLDPLLLIAASHRPLRFLIAREQFERIGLRWIFRHVGCIPVDRERRPETALRAALRQLGRGEVLAVFPHGRIQPDTAPRTRLKPGTVMMAARTGAPVVPVRIGGVLGQGRIVLAVLLRSRVHLIPFEPVFVGSGAVVDAVNDRLAAKLEGRTDTGRSGQ